MPNLVLIKVNQELFPFSQTDFDLLRERNIAVFRIPTETLPLLMKTSLKGVNVTVSQWKPTFAALRTSFLKNLTKAKLKFKEEGTAQFVIKYSAEQAESAEEQLKSLSTYVTRYGFKLSLVYRNNPDSTLVRIVVLPNPEGDPSLGFDLSKKVERRPHYINFTPVARMGFCMEASPHAIGLGSLFSVVFEDNLSGSWQETFKRSFPVSSVKKQEVLSFISGMTGLLGNSS